MRLCTEKESADQSRLTYLIRFPTE